MIAAGGLIDVISVFAVLSAFGVLSIAVTASLIGGKRLANKIMVEQRADGLAQLVLAASFVTMLWAVVSVFAVGTWASSTIAGLSSIARIGLWLAVLLWMARVGMLPISLLASSAIAGLVLALLTWIMVGDGWFLVIEVAFASAGLVLLAFMAVSNAGERFFAFKWFVLALAPLFLSEIILSLAQVSLMPLTLPQGLINALAAPLLAIGLARAPAWGPPIFISRQVVHVLSIAGVVAGVFAIWALLILSTAPRVQDWIGWISLNGLTVLAVSSAAAMFSGGVRARMSAWIDTHFFVNRYDYRQAWRVFLDGVDQDERHVDASLEIRLINSLAGLVGATGAAFWRSRAGGRFDLVAGHNFGEPLQASFDDVALHNAMLNAPAVLEKDIGGRLSDALNASPLPSAWLTIPLRRHSRLFGLMLLATPRHARPLSDEDRELVRLMADQIASYLLEDQNARDLADARAFDGFNRRFAYVLHDIKNISHELSYTLDNAKKHHGNPAFQDSLLRALGAMDERMRKLIHEVRRGSIQAEETTRLDVLIRSVVDECSDARLGMISDTCVTAPVDAFKLGAVLRHLIDNALEASHNKGAVGISLQAIAGRAKIEIQDDGCGMSRDFMKTGLFKPFKSTKPGGMGIGLVQAKSTVESMDGSLFIESREGQGTVVLIDLPLSGQDAGRGRQFSGAGLR